MKTALYLRVSTSDQTTENQLLELRQVAVSRGWEIVQVYKDEAISGSKGREQRPGLKQMMLDAHRGNFGLVAAWSVDRLGRSLSDLIRTSDDLRSLGIQLYLHKQAVDTTTPTGRMTYQILGAVAEWEREMIRQRISAGIARAKAEGKKIGGPPISYPPDVPEACVRFKAEGKPVREIAKLTGVSATTVQRILKKHKPEEWLG